MQYFSKIGGNVAAAVSAIAITMGLFTAYISPAMATPVTVLLA